MKIFLLLFVSAVAGDQSFLSFCNKPPNFGKGVMQADGVTCVITYDVSLKGNDEAAEFCDAQHPFSPLKAEKRGEQTICTIRGLFDCGAQEQLIDERCFMYGVDSIFNNAEAQCDKLSRKYKYELHKIVNTFEQKWISTFYSPYGVMWVRNTENELKHLDVANIPGKVLNGKAARFIYSETPDEPHVIITRKGSASRLRAGVVAKMASETSIPVLCSRPADPKEEYLVALAERYTQAGYLVRTYQDLFGVRRPFTVVRGLHSFEMQSRFEAGTARLHKTCQAFKHGHAVTPYDFKNPNDFKTLLKEAQVNVVAVPGSAGSAKLEPIDSCFAMNARFMDDRKFYDFDLVQAGNKMYKKTANNASFWKEYNPSKSCADMPRTALAFTPNGLVDVPNIARLFVACTFGIPPRIEGGDEAKCDRDANLLPGMKCACKNPKMELNVQSQFIGYKEDKTATKGLKCVDCTGDRQVVAAFIIDRSQGAELYSIRMVGWYMKFWMSYFRGYAKSYILMDDTYAVHPPGNEFKPVPVDSSLKDFWFWTTDSYSDERKYWYERVQGAGQRNLGAALDKAVDDLTYQQFDRKYIIAVVHDVPADLDRARAAANKAVGKVEIILVTNSNAKELADLDSDRAPVYNFVSYSYSLASTEVMMRLARRFCLKQ